MNQSAFAKQSASQRQKWLFAGVLVALALVLILMPSGLLAQDGEVTFTASSFSSGDGQAVIESHETTLSGSYFAEFGTLDGLTAGPAGLTLVAGQTSGTYISDPINGPIAVTDITPLWRADIPEGTSLTVETRLSLNGGPYSDWVESPEIFFPVRGDQRAGNLIWADGSQVALQFRVTMNSNQANTSPSFGSLTLVFSDSSNGPTDSAIAAAMPDLNYSANTCPVPRPNIVSRTQWGSPDGQGSRVSPQYQSVTNVVVHHTATSNAINQNYARVVRSIWHYHTITLGWGDIGYNYLIDPNGVIYEGRAGGDDAIGVRGIGRGPNAGAMAVGFIGCYGNCNYLGLSNAQPSTASQNSGVELMAWKLGQKNLDPNGFNTLGGIFNVPVIAGGRDVSNTYSPGDNLYNALPSLRTRTADRLNCPQACRITDIQFDRASYQQGDTVNLTVYLADQNNRPLDGANVRVDVTKPVASANTSGAINLITTGGKYEGSYSNTNVGGDYIFRISATDPNNRFTPCYAEATISVGAAATPTPAVPTATPTPTPTPTPDPSVRVEPTRLQAYLCESFEPSTAITVRDAPMLGDVRIEVSYDPSIIQVRDANLDLLGVQVRPNDAFVESPSFITRNEVDTVAGTILFEASLLGSNTIEGNDTLIVIDWFPQAAGISNIIIDSIALTDSDGFSLSPDVADGSVEILPGCPPINGTALLQGRSNHSGITVTGASGVTAQTDANGFFVIEDGEPLSFSYPGYLPAAAEVGTARAAATAADGTVEAATVGQITMLAGDMNADNVIDIFDLVYMANKLDSNDSLADLNADGQVNILDLVLVAGNYRQNGPLTAWE